MKTYMRFFLATTLALSLMITASLNAPDAKSIPPEPQIPIRDGAVQAVKEAVSAQHAVMNLLEKMNEAPPRDKQIVIYVGWICEREAEAKFQKLNPHERLQVTHDQLFSSRFVGYEPWKFPVKKMPREKLTEEYLKIHRQVNTPAASP